jgi:hypothetical protein
MTLSDAKRQRQTLAFSCLQVDKALPVSSTLTSLAAAVKKVGQCLNLSPTNFSLSSARFILDKLKFVGHQTKALLKIARTEPPV